MTDFGMSQVVEANPHWHTSPGTLVFMPLEAPNAKLLYCDKLDMFSVGVLIIQIITCKFPSLSDAEMVMEDPSGPTGEKIVLIPELER